MIKKFLSYLVLTLAFYQFSYSQNKTIDIQSLSSGIIGGIPTYTDPAALQLMEMNTELPLSLGKVDPEIYILSPFDIVSFQFEGNFSLLVKSALINAQGSVVIPQVGVIELEGKTINEALGTLKEFAKKRFIKTDVSFLSLDKAKPIQVRLNGNLKKNLRFNFNGLTQLDVLIDALVESIEVENTKDVINSLSDANNYTAFSDKNLLFESTLRTPTLAVREININKITEGAISLRDIKIRHNNGSSHEYDFIRYLKAGDFSQNPVLMNNDIIEIGTISLENARVSISGAVNSPGEFSYKKGETLSELIELGSGLTSYANEHLAQIFNVDGQSQTIEKKDWDDFEIRPNMRVIIPEIKNEIQASISIHGQVLLPGTYPIINHQSTLADLLKKAGGLKEQALLKGVYILRKSSSPPTSSEKSELDLLLKRTSDQYAQGLKYLDIELYIGQDRLYVDLTDDSLVQNIVLQDGDEIHIPRDLHSIIVFGQVNKSGLYPYDAQKTVEDYLKLSGGIALSGVKERIFIIKAGGKNWLKPDKTKLESGDMIFVDRKPYEDFITHQQLEISRTQLRLTIFSMVISAVSTVSVLLSILSK